MIASARVLRAKLFSGRSLADEGRVELQVHVIRTYIFHCTATSVLICFMGRIASWKVGNLEISISCDGGHNALPDGCLDFSICCFLVQSKITCPILRAQHLLLPNSEQHHLPKCPILRALLAAKPSMLFHKEWISQKMIKKSNKTRCLREISNFRKN